MSLNQATDLAIIVQAVAITLWVLVALVRR
jgi:hypothetical protein